VLFAQTYWETPIKSELAQPDEVAWLDEQNQSAALIVDLPGVDSMKWGFALAGRGFRPVSLYNVSPGPEEIVGPGAGPSSIWNAVIDMSPIVDSISCVTTAVQSMRLPTNAPPVFLLDSPLRTGTRSIGKGMFDNRWMVFPQDFPSANFLLAQGIQKAILVQAGPLGTTRRPGSHFAPLARGRDRYPIEKARKQCPAC
jgi:hypothetical protein